MTVKNFQGFVTFLALMMVLFLTSHVKKVDAQTINFSSLKFGGFLQQQFIMDETPGAAERFSIHRARLGVTGSITDNIRVNLIGGYVEPPDRTPRLVNAFIDFDIHPLFQVRTGQFLAPFGIESPEVIIFNPAIERTTAIRRLNPYGMFRDIGVQVGGKGSLFNYKVALVNGKGANQTEQFDPKDVLGRIGLTPFEHFELGVSGHFGQYQPDLNSDNHESRMRLGVDVSYSGDPVYFRAEYIVREDDLVDGGSREMSGWYLLGAYKFTENIQAIARFESYDPETSIGDNNYTGVLMGANYYFEGNTRLSLNYEFRDDKMNPDLGNLLTVQMQVAL